MVSVPHFAQRSILANNLVHSNLPQSEMLRRKTLVVTHLFLSHPSLTRLLAPDTPPLPSFSRLTRSSARGAVGLPVSDGFVGNRALDSFRHRMDMDSFHHVPFPESAHQENSGLSGGQEGMPLRQANRSQSMQIRNGMGGHRLHHPHLDDYLVLVGILHQHRTAL
jgi:hypothetical protein